MKRNENPGGTKSKLFWSVLLVLCMTLSGCTYGQTPQETQEETEPEVTVDIADAVDINELGINEDMTVYDEDDPDSIVYFYVTVQKGDVGSETDHTFAEVNNVVRFVDNSHSANDVYAKAIVQIGDESGPKPGMIGYGAEKSNAIIRIRGNSSSVMPQKSYKLKLDGEAGLWRGQRNIALNKSAFDLTKFRNKMYFDLLKDIEAVPSIRTQFVRLFIKDETSGKTAFEDYGLFTQAEVPNKKYLANHGLDKEGYLYKAINFNFEPSAGLKNFDDPDFDQEAFDQILSCKGKQDNQKLMDLVEMINDTSIDINDIIGNYIDRDNYITWLAYNILLANIDTTMQNYYLYSPTNSDKWFFVPWDGDNMLPFEEYRLEDSIDDYGRYQKGVTNYWGIILHQRFLKYSENRKELAAKIDELHMTINKDTINKIAAEYNQVVEPYIAQMPDLYYLGNTLEERQQIIDGLGDELETAYNQFYETLQDLMPFFIYEVEQDEDNLRLSWEEAYDFDNQEVQYHLIVSEYPDLRIPLVDETLDSLEYETTTKNLPKGTYYWTVKASTKDGKTSEPMNKIQVNDVWYPGVDILEVQ